MPPSMTESLNTLYTTTWYLRQNKVQDQIFTATPFFYLLSKKGKKSDQTGGRSIETPLRYGKNTTVTSIGRGGTVSLADTDNLTVVHWNWKYITGHIIRYFADFQQNRGKAELIKKVNSDIDTLKDSFVDALETQLFGDGTGNSSKNIDGVGNIVAEDPTASLVVGDLNQNTYSWWRNRYQDMSGYPTSIYLRKYMVNMFNQCGLQGEGVSRFPDIIVCDQTVYELYDQECFESSRVLMGDQKMADLGFGDLSFKGRPITWSPSATSGSMFFLNTNFLEWISDPIENMTLGEWLPIINQPRDVVAHAMLVANLTCSNRKRQGVIFDITETGS